MPLEPKVVTSDTSNQKVEETKKEDSREPESKSGSPKLSPKMMQIVAIVVFSIIAVAIYIVWSTNKDEVVPSDDQGELGVIAQESPTPNLVGSTIYGDQNTIDFVESDKTIQTLDGTEVNGFYRVARYTNDYIDSINYKLMREVTAQGIETYWLDAVFRGNPVTITINYDIAQRLPGIEGITQVRVEILEVYDQDGNIGELITGFTVLPDLLKEIQGGEATW